ncbi:MAG TPA: FecR domain-containing protein [Gemmatimonadaceae bacterium]|nr:FecR domain-containing protein [Gemmatimonadaceae bacterium]
MQTDAHVGSAQPHPDPARSILPDEAALRRAFDNNADGVAASAAAQLGEAAWLAPRVVEHVFLTAWRSRATLASEADLTALLERETKHDSARVLSRRMAAQRLGGGTDEKRRRATAGHAHPNGFDRESAWDHLMRELHGGDTDEAHARASAIGHHEAAAHIAEIGQTQSWVRRAAMVSVVVLCAFGGIWLLDYASRGAKLDAAVTSSSARTVESRAGQLGEVTLEDGSQVRFAPESRVFIPKEFGEDLRGIRVEGAASVQVAPGLDAPLVLKAKRATISAAGTALTVRAFPEDSVIVVAVTDGQVTVKRGDEERVLGAGQSVAVPDSSAMRAATSGELDEATAWTKNRLAVHDRRIGDVLAELRRWYNTHILVADTRVLDRRISISAPLDSVRQAIAAIEQAGSVKFGYVEDKMVFTDAAPAAKGAKQ